MALRCHGVWMRDVLARCWKLSCVSWRCLSSRLCGLPCVQALAAQRASTACQAAHGCRDVHSVTRLLSRVQPLCRVSAPVACEAAAMLITVCEGCNATVASLAQGAGAVVEFVCTLWQHHADLPSVIHAACRILHLLSDAHAECGEVDGAPSVGSRAAEAGAVTLALSALDRHEDPAGVLALTLSTLALLCKDGSAAAVCMKNACFRRLCACIDHHFHDLAVVANAAAVLRVLLVTDAMKQQAVQDGAVGRMLALLDAHSTDLCVQSLCCDVMAALASCPACVPSLLGQGCLQRVLSVLESHDSSDASVVMTSACTTLHTLTAVPSPTLNDAVRRSHALPRVLALLSNMVQPPSLLAACFSALQNLAQLQDVRAVLLQPSGVSCLLAALAHRRVSEDALVCACGVLRHLASSGEAAGTLVESGCVGAVLAMLRVWSRPYSVQFAGITTLARLLEASEAHARIAAQCDCLPWLLQALHRHGNRSSDFSASVLHALSSLVPVLNPPRAATLLATTLQLMAMHPSAVHVQEGGCATVASVLVTTGAVLDTDACTGPLRAAVALHPHSAAIAVAVCKAAASLMRSAAVVDQLIYTGFVHEVVLLVMDAHLATSALVCAWCCVAWRRMIACKGKDLAPFITAEALPRVLAAMRAHPRVVDVQAAGCEALREFAVVCACVPADGLPAVFAALGACTSSPVVLCTGCAALESFLAFAGDDEALGAAGLVLLAVLQGNLDNLAVVTASLSALRHVAFCVKDAAVSQDLLGATAAAMRIHVAEESTVVAAVDIMVALSTSVRGDHHGHGMGPIHIHPDVTTAVQAALLAHPQCSSLRAKANSLLADAVL